MVCHEYTVVDMEEFGLSLVRSRKHGTVLVCHEYTVTDMQKHLSVMTTESLTWNSLYLSLQSYTLTNPGLTLHTTYSLGSDNILRHGQEQ